MTAQERMDKNTDIERTKNFEQLVEQVVALIESGRNNVRTVVNTSMVYTYYGVGYYIVEFEQGGKVRAEYGKETLKQLSARLTEIYGDGWSYANLKNIKQFYLLYSKRLNTVEPFQDAEIVHGVYEIRDDVSEKVHSVDQIPFSKRLHSVYPFPAPSFPSTLSWSHYLILMRIKNPDERSFYEIECARQMWSVRQLQRQYNSSLYERLALSKDKNEVMQLANEGHVVEKSDDVIKNPFTLEFLGLKPASAYSENKLETAIIDKLRDFLLEMGKGFLFEARQKRFTFNEDHYFIDLVLYNRLLQCYCLVDLKVDKLTHQDLGQMQMYVNYYDRYVKQEFEKPTIGILLCKEKNDALVELTLPQDANIYAAEYALYLPDKKLLQAKLKEWIEEEDNSIRS